MTNKRIAWNGFVAALKDAPCLDCGGHFPAECMDFDHRPGVAKVTEISKMRMYFAPLDAIIAEIAKCDPICSNCHRIRTRKRNREASGNRLPDGSRKL